VIYYFGGINGVGKTTLIDAIVHRADFEAIQLTRRLISFLGLAGYDELRARSQADNRRDLAHLMDELIVGAETKHYLLDAHYLNLRKGEVDRITDTWIKDMSALILVKADPAEIYRRIKHDNKDRALLADELPADQYIERLRQYQDQTEAEFAQLAKLHMLPSLIIENNNDIAQSTERFLAFHKTLSP
jgi:adenylate kinase